MGRSVSRQAGRAEEPELREIRAEIFFHCTNYPNMSRFISSRIQDRDIHRFVTVWKESRDSFIKLHDLTNPPPSRNKRTLHRALNG